MFQIIRKKILCAKIRQVAAIRGVFIGFTNESLFFIPSIQRGVKMSKIDYQGGKAYGQLKDEQMRALEEINEQFRSGGKYDDVEDLDEKLAKYQKQFMEFDENNSGDIDMMELKRMMEKLGQPKTHLELKKMIAEVDTNNSGTIHYDEFLNMMLGKRSTILKLILMFEEKSKEKEIPKGIPPKRTLDQLP